MPPKKQTEQTEEAAEKDVQLPEIIVTSGLMSPIPMPALEADSAAQAAKLSTVPAKWANPPTELISKLPKGGTQLDYMGHADVTLALIQVDPLFDYGWLTKEDGSMLINKVGSLHILEGWVTVHGHTRRGVGTCEDKKSEIHKELIGDLLRNCAMRFGIATTLWSKAERHEWGLPQDTLAVKAFEMLRASTASLSADQRASLRSWWSANFGDIPVGAEAGTEKILSAIAQVSIISSTKDEGTPAPKPADQALEELMSAFPGSEVVGEAQ